MKFRVYFPGLMVSVLAFGGGLRAAESGWHKLLSDSPFGATAPVAAAPAAASPEFRGYVTEGREQYFNIFDPARQRSFWLREGESAGAVMVRSFDADQQSITVEVERQARTLPLKRAKVTISAPPAAGLPAAPSANPALPEGVVAIPGTGAEATDQVSVAEQNLLRARQRQAYELRQKQAQERQRQARAAREAAGTP